jgi:MvdD pre-ATP grasp domain
VTILILARDLDPTADHMIGVLGQRGVEVFRVNTAWFPTQMRVTTHLRGDRWCGTLTTPRGRLDLEQVRAVWYRSPEAYRMPHTFGIGALRQYAVRG